MQVEQQTVPVDLSALVGLSVRLGADLRLVQGAGGNLSLKRDGVLWVKASGTRLGQAVERDIFVPMDERQTRAAVLVTEDLAGYVLPEGRTAGLRPSIETALHVLLPHPVVAHVHGVGSIAAGLSADLDETLGALPGWFDTFAIPYAKPGVNLARAVLDATRDRLRPDRPVVLVLRNHGLVVGATDSEEAGRLIDVVEAAFRSTDAPVVDRDHPEGRLCPPGSVDEAAAHVLCAGALTPDSAVFLGPTPFDRVATGHAGDSTAAAFVADDGSVWLRRGLGEDEREIAASLVDIARQARGARTRALSPAEVDELVNWEAEQWRRSQKR